MKKAVILLIICCLTRYSTVFAQDSYRFAQNIDREFSTLVVNEGWNVKLIQEAAGTISRVVFVIPCPDFFDEDEQPQLVIFPAEDEMVLPKNTMLPRKTVVEIHTSHPVKDITVAPNARLTIESFNAGDTPITIDIQEDATLSIGQISSLSKVTFVTRGASVLSWERVSADKLVLWKDPRSTVIEGVTEANERNDHRVNTLESRLDKADNSSENGTIPWYNRGVLQYLDANIGVGYTSTFGNIDHTSLASPYKISNATTYMLQITTRDIYVKRYLGLRAGLNFAFSRLRLKNSVCVESQLLAIDTMVSGITHQQHLNTLSVGMPLMISFTPHASFWKDFVGFSVGVTPMFVHNRKLRSRKMDAEGKWHRSVDRIDIFRPFNIRGGIGVDLHLSPGHSLHLEFAVDLLPTFRANTGAKSIHHLGISFAL